MLRTLVNSLKLVLFQACPSDMPCRVSLLALLGVADILFRAYLFSSSLSMLSIFISICFTGWTLFYLHFCLMSVRQVERFVQTGIAILVIYIAFACFNLLLVSLYPRLFTNYIAYMILFVWEMALITHVLQAAMERPLRFAVLAAFGLLLSKQAIFFLLMLV